MIVAQLVQQHRCVDSVRCAITLNTNNIRGCDSLVTASHAHLELELVRIAF